MGQKETKVQGFRQEETPTCGSRWRACLRLGRDHVGDLVAGLKNETEPDEIGGFLDKLYVKCRPWGEWYPVLAILCKSSKHVSPLVSPQREL